MQSTEPLDIAIPIFALRKTGGIERYTWNVAQELSARGHRVTMLAPAAKHAARPPGTRGVSVGHRAPKTNVGTAIGLVTFGARASLRLASSARDAVVYGPLGSHHRSPGVVTAHAVHAAAVAQLGTHLGRPVSMFDRAMIRIERATYRRRGLAVTTVSERCASEISEIYDVPRGSITVVCPAVSTVEFPVATKDECAHARLSYGVERSTLVIGIAANYQLKVKGVDTLAQACARLGATLLVAGVPHRSESRDVLRLAGTGDVRLLGLVEDMRGFYAALDVFALPSVYEANPIAAYEAMASGVATVVSDRAGIAEGIQPEREALVVRPCDLADLTDALAALRDPSLRERLAGAGAAWVRQRSWSDVGTDIEAVLLAVGTT